MWNDRNTMDTSEVSTEPVVVGEEWAGAGCPKG